MGSEYLSALKASSGEVSLRAELALRALEFATAHKLTFDQTDGQTPGIIFRRDESGHHGNFHPLVDHAICCNPQWVKRLTKPHTASRRVRARADWRWMELDSATSSDALLMNIFCHPAVPASPAIRGLFGLPPGTAPQFGFRPRTPLLGEKRDNTEIDMRISDILLEAKLTESDFQSADPRLVLRYRDLHQAFEVEDLPQRNGRVVAYQLIRGTLAAYANGCSFCVCCDARRPDLIELWYNVIRAVRLSELRSRLKLLTWQELAAAVPPDLRGFLAARYGILPA
jgi:hypothetical protein